MAAVNTADFAGGGSSPLTSSPGVTPGGSNRAVLVATLTFADSSNYATGVTWNSGGSTAVDEFVGADTPLDIFSFVFAWAKSYGEHGSPAALTTLTSTWGAAGNVFALAALYLEDVDQTTAFGSEQASAQQFLGDDPQAVTDTRSGLTPSQLVVGFMYVMILGTNPVTSYTAGGDIDTIHGVSPVLEIDGRQVQIVAFSGAADGSGNFNPSITVDWPNTGELIKCLIVTRPVNNGGGASLHFNPLTGRGGSAALPLAV